MIKNYDGCLWKYNIFIEYYSYEYMFPYIKFSVHTHEIADDQIIPDPPQICLEIGFWHWFVSFLYCEDYEPEYKMIYDSDKWRPGEKDETT